MPSLSLATCLALICKKGVICIGSPIKCNVLQALTLLGGMATAGRNLLPDIVSYNTAIKACANGGELQRALKVNSVIQTWILNRTSR